MVMLTSCARVVQGPWWLCVVDRLRLLVKANVYTCVSVCVVFACVGCVPMCVCVCVCQCVVGLHINYIELTCKV